MLEVDAIHTYYGEGHVLHGISLTVQEGERVGLLGRNGAGKTTTIRSIIGLTPPREGRILFFGRPIQRLPPDRIARLGVGLVPQGRRIFADLTVLENLRIAARPKEGGWTVERVLDLFPVLRERASQDGMTLSGGEQQMLAIARSLVGNPTLLLMDEPSEGLAPTIIREVGEIIRELKRTGLSILLVEQNYSLALAHADRVYVLNKGQIVFQGSPADLDRDEEIKQRYLGVHARGAGRRPVAQND